MNHKCTQNFGGETLWMDLREICYEDERLTEVCLDHSAGSYWYWLADSLRLPFCSEKQVIACLTPYSA
jgi:hypothetical protein